MVLIYWASGGFVFFFFNDTATTEIYTLSLHDALPISAPRWTRAPTPSSSRPVPRASSRTARREVRDRSEEHTSELQSLAYLVCRLLLEKKTSSRRPDRRSLRRLYRGPVSSDTDRTPPT